MRISTLSLRDQDSFLTACSDTSRFCGPWDQYDPVWQTPEWGAFLIRSGQVEESMFVGVYDDDRLLCYWIIEIRRVGLGKKGGYVVGWPRCSECSEDVLRMFVNEVHTLAKSNGAVFVLFEPMEELNLPGTTAFSGQVKHLLEPYTRFINLRKTEEEILSDMKQKGRYNIRVAEKHECRVERVEPTKEHIDLFYDILKDTTERDGFSGNSRTYYEYLLTSRSHPSEWLYFARIGEKVVAAAILTITGKTAVYYYGASVSDPDLRKTMAPYLLQWEMIRAAQRAGCNFYDFLGVSPENEPDHHLAWVTEFKSKFWGNIHVWPTKQLLIVQPFKYSIFVVVRRLRTYMASLFQ